MLFNENKNYKEIDEETFNNELERFKNSSDIVGIIYYFYKDKTGNIIKKERKSLRTPTVENDLELLVKYYVIEVKVDEPICFEYEDIGNAYKIYNLGNFYISDLFKMKKDKMEEITTKFLNYDKNYNTLSFPWTDEEFITKYNRRNN